MKWIVGISAIVGSLGAYAGLFGKFSPYLALASTIALAINHSLAHDTSGAPAAQ